MRFWFDTEFIDDGRTIDLISIGIVAEDDREYYAECAVDWSKASMWVLRNVCPHLTGDIKPRSQVAREVQHFMGDKPEIWAYTAAYDWVALCQLFGSMMSVPAGWPKVCRDLDQMGPDCSRPDLIKHVGVEHNALEDAKWTKAAWMEFRSGRVRHPCP